MSEYKNKTNEELIELLEELKQSNDDLREELKATASDNNDYDKAMLQLETIAEKSFYAGRSSDTNSTPIKCWLNHKMEERILHLKIWYITKYTRDVNLLAVLN